MDMCGDPSERVDPARESAVARARGFLTFLAMTPAFASSFQLSLLFAHDAVRLDRRRRPHPGLAWATFMTITAFGCRMKRARGSRRLRRDGDGRTLYLCNHRAWSDFFVDVYLTEGRAFMMSRMLVAVVFPLFMVPAMACGCVFGFNRSGGEKDKLNAALDAHYAAYEGEFEGMVCYPEGTRNVREHSLPLKRGMLRYAHSRKMAVQVICTGRKERVFSSHLMSAERGVALPTYFSDVVLAEDHPDFEDFYNKIRAEWDESWSAVNGLSDAEVESLPDYVPRERLVRATATHDAVMLGGLVCLALGAALVYRGGSRAFGLL